MKNEKPFLALAMLLLPLLPLTAQEGAIIVFSHHDKEKAASELHAAIEYTTYAMDIHFLGIGIEAQVPYINDEQGDFSTEELRRRCQDAGVRWALLCYTAFQDGRLSWRFSVYDVQDGMIRAAENFFTALYAGVETQEAINASMQRLIRNYQKSFPASEFDGAFAVSVPQRFTSSEDGIEVRFGDEQGASAGTIKNGELTTPLFLFIQGMPVYGTLTKDGYWPKTFTLRNGVTDEVVALPPLMKKARHSLVFMTESRDFARYALDFDYRLHILPDRWFLKLGYALWQDKTLLSSNRETLHQELRFGTGLYVLPRNNWAFRMLLGSGVSLAFADGGSTFIADPLWLGLEYHFSRWALVSEVRFPEVLGYSRNTFGSDKTDFGVCLSFGVMLKW
jgi:hypothetical protein